MITGKQTFKNSGRADLEVSHAPRRFKHEYLMTFEQGGNKVSLDLLDLKRINRVANKNIKELIEYPELRERIENGSLPKVKWRRSGDD